MSKEDWNTRYSTDDYIYGTAPNEYLRQFLEGKDPGKILFPAEDLRTDFSGLEVTEFVETHTFLNDGALLQGEAEVIRITGRRE